MANLAEAIKPNLDRTVDKFKSQSILSVTFVDDVTSIQGDSDYKKASKIVSEIYRRIKHERDADQYLTKVCDVLLEGDDDILRDIAKCMKGHLH